MSFPQHLLVVYLACDKSEFGGAYADEEENKTIWNGPCSCFSSDFYGTQSN